MAVFDFVSFYRKISFKLKEVSSGIALFVSLLLLFPYICVSAQTINVDTLNLQAESLLDVSPEQSLHLSLQSVQVALRTNYLSGHTQALNLVGQSYYRLNNYQKALQYFSQALDKAKQRKQDPEAADAYEFLGQAYFGFGDYDQSLGLFFHSLGLREKMRDKAGTAQSLMLIGAVYDAWGKLDKAEDYYKRSLKLWQNLEDINGVATAYAHLGHLHDKRQEYTQALDYLTKSLSIHQKHKYTRGLSQTLHSIGEVYYHQQKYDKALNYYFRALKREQQLRVLYAVARSYNSIAACYAATHKHQQAIYYYEKAIEQGRKGQTRESLMNAYQGMAESYGELKKYQDAYLNHRIYSAIRDSIFNSQTHTEIAEVEAKYKLANQQQEVEILQKERRINAITLRENRNLTYLMGVLWVVLLVLAVVLISRYRLKQRASKQLEARNQIIYKQNTELQQANHKLTASEGNLQNLVATKDKFFTIVSHDLRGPLNSLAGLFQVLFKHIDHFEKAELKKFVQDMNGTVQNLLDLVENLLHWSRTQRGGIRYEPQPLHLQTIVVETLALDEKIAVNKQIDLQIMGLPNVSVYADKNMFQFVLRNLVGNAIKFTHEGGMVKVEATVLAEEQVAILITDNGTGIAPHDLPKLFRIDMYHTAKGTANESGTGLGLILCQEFVSRNGGEITVKSILGRGSVFRFTVPISVLVPDVQSF